jgi:DNA-directed RNA polymerase subunit omega
LDFIDSKFRLALLAARRAKQLVGGSKKKLEVSAENPLTIAMQEIYQGRVNFEILDEEQMEKRKEFEEAQRIEEVMDVEEDMRMSVGTSVSELFFEGREREEEEEEDEEEEEEEEAAVQEEAG